MVSLRSPKGESINLLKEQFTQVKEKMTQLEKIKDNNVEGKLTSFPPSFALIIKNNGFDDSEMLVKIYGHKQFCEGRFPIFWLYIHRDNYWFSYFENQFSVLWNDQESTPLEIV